LSGNLNPRKLDRSFAATNRLRTEGLDILVAAARAAGARRIVAQSFTGWPNERTGGPIKTETDPIDPSPPKGSHDTLAAIRHVEATMTGLGDMAGVALRYGGFYGPGASAEMLDLVGGRKLPIVGGGAGILSFIHIADAAAATRLAIEGGAPGLYNIVDDEPAPVSEWLPYLARLLDAKPPLRVPAWLVRPVVGDFVIAMMTTSRGSSNAKAKRDLGWTPAYPSWRQGFPDWISGAGRCRTGRG
jgi:nucleoside-diphosphate-sugar epimerase